MRPFVQDAPRGAVAGRWASIADFLAEWLDEPRLAPEQQATLDRYYHHYRRRFGTYVRHHYADQTRELMALINQGAKDILEVGAGCGTEGLWCALNGATVVSIDINLKRLDVAWARQELIQNQCGLKLDLSFRNESFLDLDLRERFDIVWMEQTFHHLEPRARIYAAVARALRAGGYVVVSEANGWNLLLQSRLFLQRGFRTRVSRRLADGRLQHYGNERITVPYVLGRSFRAVGIAPVSLRYFRMLPNAWWAERLWPLEKAVPTPLRPLLFSHFNFVGRKVTSTADKML